MDFGLFQAYAALLVLATLPIYAGSWESVDDPNDKSTTKKKAQKETFSSSDAYWFPITGSATLFGLYLVFRFFEKEYVNYLLTAYFGVIGFGALATLVAGYMTPLEERFGLESYGIKLTKAKEVLYSVKFTNLTVASSVVCLFVTVFWIVSKHWMLNNIFGITFSVTAIALLNLDSFKTGMALLAGLFFYDVFWVFGTDVMVTVAKSFDAPIKMLWPKSVLNTKAGFTMLGLGDIVIPGIYVALCLRFDFHNYLLRNKQGRKGDAQLTTPYFTACFAAYIAGLITTVFVMHTFKAAQPALLYLSPACILSSAAVALVKGQIKEFFAWSSEVDMQVASDAAPKKSDKKTKKALANKTKSSLAAAANAAPSEDHDGDDDDDGDVSDDSHSLSAKSAQQPLTAVPTSFAAAAVRGAQAASSKAKKEQKPQDQAEPIVVKAAAKKSGKTSSPQPQQSEANGHPAQQDEPTATKKKKNKASKNPVSDDNATTASTSLAAPSTAASFTASDATDAASNEDSDMIPVLSRKDKKLRKKQQA
ncbi:hypothetical protein RI367_004824 [Sorochytrium milnesiophthora]